MSDFEEEMNELNGIEDALDEAKELTEEMAPKEEMNSWTSIDLYYKGFHIKKSMPSNITPSKLKDGIEAYMEAGFEPSWNQQTNGEHKIEQKIAKPCTVEGCQGTMSFKSGISQKTNKPWKGWFCDLSRDHTAWER